MLNSSSPPLGVMRDVLSQIEEKPVVSKEVLMERHCILEGQQGNEQEGLKMTKYKAHAADYLCIPEYA